MSEDQGGAMETGPAIIYSDEPGATCPGGKPLADCETVQAMLSKIGNLLGRQESSLDGTVWRCPLWLGQICTPCGMNGQIEYQTIDRRPTGAVRIRFDDAP